MFSYIKTYLKTVFASHISQLQDFLSDAITKINFQLQNRYNEYNRSPVTFTAPILYLNLFALMLQSLS